MSQQQTPLRWNETASQTGGPYVHIGLAPQQAGFEIFDNNFGNVLAAPGTPGEPIVIEGQVIDGTGAPMRDVLLEIWQADHEGRYAHPEAARAGTPPATWRGWGRTGADFDTGLYRFETIKPGRVPGPGGTRQAPHVNVWIVARGINVGLATRLYFGDEAAANAEDPVLNSIEHANRRPTLIATRSERDGRGVYRFDVVVQSSDPTKETVFFDF